MEITKRDENEKKAKLPIGMMVYLLILTIIIAFFTGILPIAPIVVATGSMEPAIGVGDVVLVCEMDSDNLDIGDIIQYSKKSYTVIHRIVDKNVEENGITWFTTKGDYNNAPDAEKVLPEQIEGRVVLIIPEIGRLILRIHGV